MPEPFPKKLVVVLGVARSGTSAITRALQTIGVELGDRLYGERDFNVKGVWEDIDIHVLDNEILKALKRHWNSLVPIGQDDLEVLRKRGFFLNAVRLLREKTKGVSIFGFKDPHAARLLPFWKAVFDDCQVDVVYIVVLRNPISAVKSLIEFGEMEAEESYLLWLSSCLAVLTGSAGSPRVVVDYDRMMESPDREVMRIAKCSGLEINSDELQIYKNEFLDPELRHSVHIPDDLALDERCPQIVREIYPALLDVASDKLALDDLEFQGKVERWLCEFDRMRPALAAVDKIRWSNSLLHSSNSMRITSPLRFAGRAARKLFGMLRQFAEKTK